MTKKLSDYVKQSEQICTSNIDRYLFEALLDGVTELQVTKDELITIFRARVLFSNNKESKHLFDYTYKDLFSDVMGMKLTLIK